MVVSDAERTSSTQVRKSRSSLPTIGIYRPPAARRSTEDSSKPSAESVIVATTAKDAVKPTRARVRRPDQQVYVPRAKRAFADTERFEDPTPSSVENRPSRISSLAADVPCREKCRSENLIIEDRKSCKPRSSSPSGWLPARASQLVETKKKLCQSTSSDLDLEERKSCKPRSSSPSGWLPARASQLVETKKKLCQSTSSDLDLEDRKSCKPRSSSPSGWLPARASQLVETKKKLCQSTSSDLDLEGISRSIPSDTDKISPTMNPSPPLNLPPRAEVLVEKKKKLCQTNSLTEEYKWKPKEEADQGVSVQLPDSGASSEQISICLNGDENCSENIKICECVIASVIETKVTSSVNEGSSNCDNIHLDDSSQSRIQETSNSVSTTVVSKETNPIRKASVGRGDCTECSQIRCSSDSSDDDYQDTHSRGKSNGLIESSGGSSESLSSSDSLNAHVTPVQLMKPVKAEPKKKSSDKPARVFNPDECDWDALLDEDGDVLDPFLMKELTSAVGEVKVTQPKSDYRNYKSQVPADHPKTRRSTGDDDFSHVVEISSFPPEFKTHDLVAVLSPFKNTAGGFEIKWVDDTHALGVFASALIAEQVLAYQHPMVRTRPLCDATLESRLKARRLSESIHSFRPRPETCAALARRLVTGALGVKLPTARQEREEEKRVLREAREKRRLAVQQQDDIWNS
ncbi:Coiled-coil domain-containing protein R3HCC1L [Frankliniella fusca]|uniref:Coiled-coil domain-containing protein R3HCC1L n=1 Tax=Frankliniella fusca TaxID=407009 RepID=A0AAE1LU00_9NEOP|nr:Coiled-coil domain-containing protein R3HCC1L [Frankliniella fusca]